MANVTLGIGNLKYTVACAENQEEKLIHIAKMLDEKVSYIKSKALVSEGLGLVMGSLMLISELNEEIQTLSEKNEKSSVSPELLSETTLLIEKVSNKISSVAETIENA